MLFKIYLPQSATLLAILIFDYPVLVKIVEVKLKLEYSRQSFVPPNTKWKQNFNMLKNKFIKIK